MLDRSLHKILAKQGYVLGGMVASEAMRIVHGRHNENFPCFKVGYGFELSAEGVPLLLLDFSFLYFNELKFYHYAFPLHDITDTALLAEVCVERTLSKFGF